MKKTKLLPICGALASTAAIVTPLATSCSSWTRYTDMLSEYKPGVTPYGETWFDEDTAQSDIDELYGERFEKNNDILRDDMLGSLSKIMCYENTPYESVGDGGGFNTAFKKINKYNFDIHVDKVIPYNDEETELYEPLFDAAGDYIGVDSIEVEGVDVPQALADKSSIQFTIEGQFKAEFNDNITKPIVHIDGEDNRTMDVIDIDLKFKTVDPGIVGFENNYTFSEDGQVFDDEGMMSLYRPYLFDKYVYDETDDVGVPTFKPGMVCIDADVSYRYSTLASTEGRFGENVSEHAHVRNLSNLVEDIGGTFTNPIPVPTNLYEDSSVYTFMYGYLIYPLEYHIGTELAYITDENTNYFAFCSHYLQNVDYY